MPVLKSFMSPEEIEQVTKVFANEVGYTCQDKNNKYAKTFDDHFDDWKWYNGRKNGGDYCTIYFDWCFVTAFGVDKARKMLNRPLYSCGAGVRYSREYLKSIGRVSDTPAPGCAVYFGDLPYPRHIGFVYKVTDTMIYTYEGNCTYSKNVTGVKARSYNRNNSDILDYGYPVYDETPEPGPQELDGYKVGNTYEVMYDDLQVRKGPGLNYSTVGSLSTGDKVECIELYQDSSKRTWIFHKTGWSCAHEGDKRYIDAPKKTGWVKIDGNWYYYDENGMMVRNEWQLYKGDWYFLGDLGAMVTGWYDIKGSKYYFYPDGHMASSEWVDGLALDASGKQTYQKKATWRHNSKGWWFEDETGWYPKGRSIKINRVEYEFDSVGYVIEK